MDPIAADPIPGADIAAIPKGLTAIGAASAPFIPTLAVEAAAPSEEDKGMISERMLIMLAEALQKKRPSLAKNALVTESHSIAVDQKRLRRTVGEIVFTRLGGDPSGEGR